MRLKKVVAVSLCAVSLLGLAACASNNSASTTKKSASTSSSNTKILSNVTYQHAVKYYRGGTTYSGKAKSLKLDTKKYTTKTITVNKKKIKVRCYTNLTYVSKPVSTKYQTMNIYVPEKYFHNGKINGYTKTTAPIFMPNNVGGYMSGTAGTLTGGSSSGAAPSGSTGKMSGTKPSGKAPSGSGSSTSLNANGGASTTSASQKAISEGYIVAAPGARGRDAKQNGKYTGKAPAGIVDLKAAVRYLKYNSSRLPGNTNRIISDGTSAGGALSALLGSTGNSKAYAPYLKAIGAANTSDNIYTAVAFCPITNLDHADSAYEWQFNGINSISGGGTPGSTNTATTLTTKQKKASQQLKADFVTYVNGLNLKNGSTKLQLNSDGTGSFATLVEKEIMNSAQTALDNGTTITTKKYPWLTIKNKQVTAVNLTKYFKSVGRSKATPAFDAFDISNAENIEFGDSTTNAKHFTNFSMQRNTAKQATQADSSIVKLMNPMAYIGSDNATLAKHFWIRYGEKDANTSVAVPTLLSQKLKNAGADVNYHVQWNTGHAGDYDLNAMFKWLNSKM
ncbi:alpha/beta hydrolase [Lactiplantibacillus fabifermentans T30PCM01]|uniref:Alpha beta superfamily hydrolase n=2 Tax=Lactiplantibacillus fabifermentans TaxID=483011 RepID=A0A0R2NFY2_9LACO|nr:alpha/beta hydrolase [Lactiplantibacillus fabifermentans T30PCM01]KRO24709.1 alpha beta superfamily hydrolase [Lactiplantibacillus fabifermentans DSM 21115]